MKNTNEKRLKPWFSILLKPRETIQQITESNPKGVVWLLVAIVGFSNALERASMKNMGDKFDWPIILIYAVIVGTITGMIGLFIGSGLARWTGKWIGGKGSKHDIRAAIAWSSMPIIWGLILWIPKFALFGQEIFTTKTPIIDNNSMMLSILLGFMVMHSVLLIWSLILLIKTISQVQSFSVWRAISNLMIPILLIIVVVGVFRLYSNTNNPKQYIILDSEVVQEVMRLAQPAKTAINEYYLTKKKLPNNNQEAGIPAETSIKSNYFSSIYIKKSAHIVISRKYTNSPYALRPINFIPNTSGLLINWECTIDETDYTDKFVDLLYKKCPKHVQEK